MITIVIPALNESRSIEKTICDIKNTLQLAKLIPYEIIVVDDGSIDETGNLAKEFGATVIRHPHNIGYGAALKSGIKAANYDMVVITDSDGTYPILSIPILVERYNKGFDMVVGQRTGKHYRSSILKWIMRILFKFLVEWTAGRKIPDINSGLRIFSKKTILTYFPHLCDTFSFTTSATLAYMMTTRFVEYVPINYNERIGRSHVHLWRDSLRTLQFIIQAITYYNPLKIFLLMSIICIIFAIVSIMIGIFFHIATGFSMGVAAIFGSIIIFSLGLLADLLRKIMLTNKN